MSDLWEGDPSEYFGMLGDDPDEQDLPHHHHLVGGACVVPNCTEFPQPSTADPLEAKIAKLETDANSRPMHIADIVAVERTALLALLQQEKKEAERLGRIDEWKQMHAKYPTAPYIPDFIWKERLAELEALGAGIPPNTEQEQS